MREIADKAREGVRESEHFDLQVSLVERWVRYVSMSSGVEVRLGGEDFEVIRSPPSWRAYLPTNLNDVFHKMGEVSKSPLLVHKKSERSVAMIY